jgi:hypothetical protein
MLGEISRYARSCLRCVAGGAAVALAAVPLVVAHGGVASASSGRMASRAYPDRVAARPFAAEAHRAGTWGTAREVPGTAALNQGGSASVYSVSCASAGNCVAGGLYTDGSGHKQAFVVTERSGTWGTAREVPGTAALNRGGAAVVNSVSCASAGNCSAGGYYSESNAGLRPFVVNQTNGTWAKAQRVLGTPTPEAFAQINSLSCASAGNCSAGGDDEAGGFVVGETNGAWGTAQQLPSSAALSGFAVLSVSCASAGNCSAGGNARNSSNLDRPFVVNETNGAWGTAQQVPGITALGRGGDELRSLSCGAAGSCSAVGDYYSKASGRQAYVVIETGGTWGKALEVPGTAQPGADAEAVAVSCASAGNCSAGGIYGAGAFVVSETGGTWGTAQQVPGSAALGGYGVLSISCASAGNCGAGGDAMVSERPQHGQVFVADQTGGTWGTAQPIPGSAALNQGQNGSLFSVSCGAAGNCSAGGFYTDGSGHQQALVASETSGT